MEAFREGIGNRVVMFECYKVSIVPDKKVVGTYLLYNIVPIANNTMT